MQARRRKNTRKGTRSVQTVFALAQKPSRRLLAICLTHDSRLLLAVAERRDKNNGKKKAFLNESTAPCEPERKELRT
jgi:hypothetical protein